MSLRQCPACGTMKHIPEAFRVCARCDEYSKRVHERVARDISDGSNEVTQPLSETQQVQDIHDKYAEWLQRFEDFEESWQENEAITEYEWSKLHSMIDPLIYELVISELIWHKKLALDRYNIDPERHKDAATTARVIDDRVAELRKDTK